jgi:tetratricopeptide (TPR) repeat protein
MKRSVVAGSAALLLVSAGAAFWLARDRVPTVAAPDEPLPWNEQVELHFPADEDGETDTWVVTKKETSREESLKGSGALPEPAHAEEDRVADEAARALTDHARGAWRSGDLTKAIELYAKAVEADPDDWVPHAQYGRMLAMMREDARAGPILERAAALAPGDPQRWLDLQTFYERTLQLDLAFKARERADALSRGRSIERDWAGFYTIEGSEEIP